MNNQSQFGRVEVNQQLVDVSSGESINEVSVNFPSNGQMSVDEAQQLIDSLQEAVNHGRSLLG